MTEGLIEALEPLFLIPVMLDAVLAKNEDEAQALWQLREEIPTAVRSSGGNIKNDISVPRGSLCRFIRETFAEFEENAVARPGRFRSLRRRQPALQPWEPPGAGQGVLEAART